MSVGLGQQTAGTPLAYFPLPQNYYQPIRQSLLACSFLPNAIRDGHDFTVESGRLRVNCVAFADQRQWDPDTASVAVYYDPENRYSEPVILDQMIYSGAPFVFIGRQRNLLPFGMNVNTNVNTKIEPRSLGDAIPYNAVGEFLERHKVDINPQRIIDVKRGLTKFSFFPELNPFQLRLFIFPITRNLLAKNFSSAVHSLRSGLSKRNGTNENLVPRIAVQLLGAIILAHKGVLGDIYRQPDAAFVEVFKRASERFPSYFDWKLTERYAHTVEQAYSFLQQAGYSSFTPDMLDELYLRAYPDAQKRKIEGRFDTPLYLARRILDSLPIETIPPDKRLLADITCGWGSFLVAGYERLSRMSDMDESQRPLWEHIIGNDIDMFTAQLAQLALLTTSLNDSWKVESQDALKLRWPGRFPTIIVGNPKFRSDRKSGKEAIEVDTATGKAKRLQEADRFLQKAIKLLAPGGFLGMLMPQSFTVAEASTETRKILLERCDVLELWDLPIATFGEQATVSPMVIFAQKRKETGSLVNYPVRIRVAQGDTFERIGVFDSSSLAISQGEWGVSSRKARSSQTKVTHLIVYKSILPETKWNEILKRCSKLTEVADIMLGAIVGSEHRWRWADFPTPKWVPWLSSAKQSMPRPFSIKYGTEKILYPNELEEPRKDKRYPKKDKEHLLSAKKVLLISDPNPSWGKRAKVAIDRRGFYASNHFWIFIPKPNLSQKISLEVLAAVLSWEVSNAWLVESFRNPWIQKRILNDIPFPSLSEEDCQRLERAIIEIEAAAHREELASQAQSVLDDVLKKAYELDEKTFQILRNVMKWDSHASTTIDQPLPPDPKTIFRVSGQVQAANASEETITLWFDGIPGIFTVPIVDEMSGWFLREDAAFRAEVSAQPLRNRDGRNLKWWNIHPKEYTYLSEDELLQKIALELVPA
ncbi:MAG: HsdM family class I SAM-dependent methyltransferase [bacterium]